MNGHTAFISLVQSLQPKAAVEPRINQRPKKTIVATNLTMANSHGAGVPGVPFQAHKCVSALYIPL